MKAKRHGAERSGRRPLKIIMWGGVGVALLALAGFFYRGETRDGPAGSNPLPAFAVSRGAPVREAYAYAVEHPEVLRYIPCYCGCVAQGHTNNEECFVDKRHADGTIAFESHGST